MPNKETKVEQDDDDEDDHDNEENNDDEEDDLDDYDDESGDCDEEADNYAMCSKFRLRFLQMTRVLLLTVACLPQNHSAF